MAHWPRLVFTIEQLDLPVAELGHLSCKIIQSIVYIVTCLRRKFFINCLEGRAADIHNLQTYKLLRLMGLIFTKVLSSQKCVIRLLPTEFVHTLIVKAMSFDFYGENVKTIIRPIRSLKKDSKGSVSFKNRSSRIVELKQTVSFKELGKEEQVLAINDNQRPLTIQPPNRVMEIFSSPKPATNSTSSELDHAAAVKVQKVYKSYRTRRNLADCAVVVEELWWKALESAALRRCSVSFFDIGKQESIQSRWARARTRAAKVGKGLSKDENAQKLSLQHWLEAIDPRHRYGHNLHFYFDVWFDSESCQPFFYWLDLGDGKEVNLESCTRNNLQRQCIQYLGPKEREAYEVVVENGKLVYKQSQVPLNTDEGSKWIFVLSTSRKLYVGQKKKGRFQHSSFLSGAATTASGRLVAEWGDLKAIWPYSGHYHPTEESFNEFISFLEEQHVNLSNVKRCATDDDMPSTIAKDKCSLREKGVNNHSSTQNEDGRDILNLGNPEKSKTDRENRRQTERSARTPRFQLAKPLSCKWTTGAGPRIGCVRDYPSDLQLRAMETVNLSPRLNPTDNAPIPSPRPSPKVRLSPRIAYMGLPSPRLIAPHDTGKSEEH